MVQAVGATELKTWLPKVAGLPAHKSENVEGLLWKRVVRKNKELARILEEQWTGTPAVGFLLSVVYLFSSAGGKNLSVPSQSRGSVTGLTSRQHISPLLSSWVDTVQGSI